MIFLFIKFYQFVKKYLQSFMSLEIKFNLDKFTHRCEMIRSKFNHRLDIESTFNIYLCYIILGLCSFIYNSCHIQFKKKKKKRIDHLDSYYPPFFYFLYIRKNMYDTKIVIISLKSLLNHIEMKNQ